MPDPVRVNVVKSNPTDSLTTAAHVVDIVVTNAGASSTTVFEHFNTEEESPGRWFKLGVSFEVGDVANRFGDAVIETDSIFTGRTVKSKLQKRHLGMPFGIDIIMAHMHQASTLISD